MLAHKVIQKEFNLAGDSLDGALNLEQQTFRLLAENEASLSRLADVKADRLSQSLDEDAALAARLQALYDQDQIAKRQALESFECEICFETLPHDYIVQFERCHHSYCRDCIRSHVSSTLTERRYPILCPSCVAGKADEAAGALYVIQRPHLS